MLTSVWSKVGPSRPCSLAVSVSLRRTDVHAQRRVQCARVRSSVYPQLRDQGLCTEAAQVYVFMTLSGMEDVATAQRLTQGFGPYSPSAPCDLDPTLTS